MEIFIERFKNIKSTLVLIDPLTLLIGGNNSGKSSILQAIQFAVSVAQTTLSQNAQWRDNRVATSISPNDLVYSPLRDVYALAPGGRLKEDKREAIAITFKIDGQECRVEVRKGRNKNISIELLGEELGRQLQSFDNPFSIIVPGLAGIPPSEEYETPLLVRKSAAKGDSNSVFRNILWILKRDAGRWQEFSNRLNQMFPSLSIDIIFDEERNEHIECQAIVNGVALPIDSCGTGVLQAIQILAYTSLYRPKILILDEPDSHLHPNNQRKLSTLLESLSKPEMRIIVSTHSLHLVDSLLDNAKTHWVRNGQIIDEADNYELKALIEIGALNEGEELRNAKNVILTEDENKHLIQCLLSASGYDLDECEVWSYNGCSNVQTAKALIRYIKKHNSICNIIVHRDRDCMIDEEVQQYCDDVGEDRVKCFIPKHSDVESLFCTPEHITALYPSIVLQQATELFNKVIAARHDQILSKFINSRTDFLKKQGKPLNVGEIAINCQALLQSNPRKYANGKTIMAGLHEEIQALGESRVSLGRQSTVLSQEELTQVIENVF